MSDYCIRVTAAEGQVRCWVASTTQMCDEARMRHDTYPTATAALGRLLTAGVMMGLNLKGEDTLTLRVMGDGPLGALVAVANAKGEVRGYVQNPHVHLPSKSPGKLDVGSAVGTNGFLYVIKDLGLKDPYTGSVALMSGEIAEDITLYFAESEQTPSVVALGVLVDNDNSVKASGGFILQLMPGATEEVISQIEKNIANIPPVSQMINEGVTPEQIAEKLLEGMESKVLEDIPVIFKCKCSRERLEGSLKSLGKDELQSILEEDGQAELVCHFCGEKYQFEKEDLVNLINEINENK